jgi:hypothetical protein
MVSFWAHGTLQQIPRSSSLIHIVLGPAPWTPPNKSPTAISSFGQDQSTAGPMRSRERDSKSSRVLNSRRELSRHNFLRVAWKGAIMPKRSRHWLAHGNCRLQQSSFQETPPRRTGTGSPRTGQEMNTMRRTNQQRLHHRHTQSVKMQWRAESMI